ncbi:hypothetical protein Tco_0805572 [Tanacetum coccineum]
MNPIATQQVALDNALVSPEKRLNIEKCNARIKFSKPQREETYQVILDALKLSPCYPAFLITAEVPEVYTHQFWNTIKKIKDTDAYRFKLDKKKFRVDTEVFHEILQMLGLRKSMQKTRPPRVISSIDLTAFCFKTSLRFASRPHCVLLQDLIAFCFKLSLRFASTSLRFAQDLHCVLLKDHIAF